MLSVDIRVKRDMLGSPTEKPTGSTIKVYIYIGILEHNWRIEIYYFKILKLKLQNQSRKHQKNVIFAEKNGPTKETHMAFLKTCMCLPHDLTRSTYRLYAL